MFTSHKTQEEDQKPDILQKTLIYVKYTLYIINP